MIYADAMPRTDDIVPQHELLIQLAAAVRPRWTEDDIRAAIAGALAVGWTWPKILAQLAVLMNDPSGHPRHLSTRRPPGFHPTHDPGRIRALVDEQWPNAHARRDPNR